MERCDCAILSILRRMTADDFGRIEDVTEGLEHRIIAALQTAQNTAQLYDLIKSKRYTHARIRRIILRAFLGIETEIFPRVPYLKILGFHERAIPLLKQMRTNATLPLLQKHSDIKQMNEACQSLYQAECDFTDQYALGFKPVRACGMEMTQSIIKIKQEAVDL